MTSTEGSQNATTISVRIAGVLAEIRAESLPNTAAVRPCWSDSFGNINLTEPLWAVFDFNIPPLFQADILNVTRPKI
jgi:hypothetical protein